jgi:hypothetical protein
VENWFSPSNARAAVMTQSETWCVCCRQHFCANVALYCSAVLTTWRADEETMPVLIVLETNQEGYKARLGQITWMAAFRTGSPISTAPTRICLFLHGNCFGTMTTIVVAEGFRRGDCFVKPLGSLRIGERPSRQGGTWQRRLIAGTGNRCKTSFRFAMITKKRVRRRG